jgi:hypothetical protein
MREANTTFLLSRNRYPRKRYQKIIGRGNLYDQISEESRPSLPASVTWPDRAGFIKVEGQDKYHDDGLACRYAIHAVSRGLRNRRKQSQLRHDPQQPLMRH